MVLGKKVASFDWIWGLNSAPREGQKIFARHYMGMQDPNCSL